jgi:hypothetical protein
VAQFCIFSPGTRRNSSFIVLNQCQLTGLRPMKAIATRQVGLRFMFRPSSLRVVPSRRRFGTLWSVARNVSCFMYLVRRSELEPIFDAAPPRFALYSVGCERIVFLLLFLV